MLRIVDLIAYVSSLLWATIGHSLRMHSASIRGYRKSLPSPFGRGVGGEGLVKEHKLRKYCIRQNALTLTLFQRARGPFSYFTDSLLEDIGGKTGKIKKIDIIRIVFVYYIFFLYKELIPVYFQDCCLMVHSTKKLFRHEVSIAGSHREGISVACIRP
jgi:hypothetical protein